VYHHLSTRNWGWFFPPSFVDKSGISSKVFAIVCGLVPCGDQTLPCPTCGYSTEFQQDSSRAFGWRYRCTRSKSAKSKKSKTRRCHGSVTATKNTWLDDSNAIVDGMSPFFPPLYLAQSRCQISGGDLEFPGRNPLAICLDALRNDFDLVL